MNIGQALARGRSQLANSSSAALDARLLLQHVLERGHSYLAAHPEEQLTLEQRRDFEALLARAGRGEPIPYLTGSAPFYGLTFRVSPAVLIPRPETEQLVAAALDWLARHPRARQLVDVGTGSGCIAVTLAVHRPDATITAIDPSPGALTVARDNAARHNVADRIHFHLGELLQPAPERVDLIVANLPYVSDAEWTSLDDGVKLHEPAQALRGGPDGLDLIRALLGAALARLNRPGALLLEIGWRQGTKALVLAQAAFPWARTALLTDFAGHDRIVTIELS